MSYQREYIKFKKKYIKLKSSLFNQNGGFNSFTCLEKNGNINCKYIDPELECSKNKTIGSSYDHYYCKVGERCKAIPGKMADYYCKPKEGPINVPQGTKIKFFDFDKNKQFEDYYQIKSGQIESGASAKNMLVKDGKVEWILDSPIRETTIIYKLAKIFNLEDTIPKGYLVEYDNKITTVLEHIDFGTSHLDFLNKLKTESGALGLFTVMNNLKDQTEINKFFEACDSQSYQRMLLFAVLINHRDLAPRNVMLQYSPVDKKIKFKLIDFDDVFNYGRQMITISLLSFNPNIGKHNLIKISYPNIKKKLTDASMLFEEDGRKNFMTVLNYFLDNYLQKDDIIEELKNYFYSYLPLEAYRCLPK